MYSFNPHPYEDLDLTDWFDGYQILNDTKKAGGAIDSFIHHFKTGITSDIMSMGRRTRDYEKDKENPMHQPMTYEDFESSGYKNSGIEYKNGLTRYQAMEQWRDNLYNIAHTNIVKQKGSYITRDLLAPLAAAFTDPVTLALCWALPGSTTVLKGLGAIYKQPMNSMLKTAIGGFGEAAIFGTALEGIMFAKDYQMNREHSTKDIIKNIGLMSLLGMGLHTGGRLAKGLTKGGKIQSMIENDFLKNNKNYAKLYKNEHGSRVLEEALVSVDPKIIEFPKDIEKILGDEFKPLEKIYKDINKDIIIKDTEMDLVKQITKNSEEAELLINNYLENEKNIKEAIGTKSIDEGSDKILKMEEKSSLLLKTIQRHIIRHRNATGYLSPHLRPTIIAAKMIEEGYIPDVKLFHDLEEIAVKDILQNHQVELTPDQAKRFFERMKNIKQTETKKKIYITSTTEEILASQEKIIEIAKENNNIQEKIDSKTNELANAKDNNTVLRINKDIKELKQKTTGDLENEIIDLAKKNEIGKDIENLIDQSGKGRLRRFYNDVLKYTSDKVEGIKRAILARANSANYHIFRYGGTFRDTIKKNKLNPETFTKDLKELIPSLEKEIGFGETILNIHMKTEEKIINKEFIPYARAIIEHQEFLLNEAKSLGLKIEKLTDRIGRTTHDEKILIKEGFKAWYNHMLPRVNLTLIKTEGVPLTQASLLEVEKYFQQVFNNITNKIPPNTKLYDLKPQGQKKFEMSRELPFLTAKGWVEYNSRFGKYGILESLEYDAAELAKVVAHRLSWGNQSAGASVKAITEVEIKKLKNKLLETLTETESKAINKQISKLENTKFDNLITEIDGTNVSMDNWLGKSGAIARSLRSMALLGNVFIRSIPDMMVLPLIFTKYGGGYLSNLADIGSIFTRRLFGNLSSVEQHEILWLKDMLFSLRNEVLSRFDMGEMSISKGFTMLKHAYPYMNFSHFWDQSMRSLAGLKLAKEFGNYSKFNLATLPRKARHALNEHGLLEFFPYFKDCVKIDEHGRHIFSYNKIKTIKNTNELVKKFGKDWQTQFEYKIYNATKEVADMTTIFPTLLEKAVLLRGTSAGSLDGEIYRCLAQFKNYPLGMLLRVLRGFADVGIPLSERTYGMSAYKNLFHLNKLPTLGGFGLGLYTLTYLTDELTRFTQGKNPRDPFHKDVIFDTFDRSCMAGIFGDAIMQFGLGNGSVEHWIAAPVLSSLYDSGFKNIKKGDISRTLIDLVHDFTPTVNLFYTKGLLNEALWHPLKEWSHTGWKRKHFKHVIKREQKQGASMPWRKEFIT